MRKMLLVFVALAVVTGGLVAFRHAARLKEEALEKKAVASAGMDLKFDPALVTACTVKAGHETVEMVREAGGWLLANRFGGLPADSAVFSDFLVSLKNITTEERSSDPALLKEYALTDGEAITVTLVQSGRTVDELLLGFKATDKGNNFIRRKGSARVYAVNEDVLRYLGFGKAVPEKDRRFDIDQWIDKRVVAFPSEAVGALRITSRGRTYADLVKDPGAATWHARTAYPYPVDAAKVKNYMDMLAGQRGFAIVPADKVTWSPEDWTLTLEVKGTGPLTIRRQYTKNGEFFVRVGDRPYAVQVSGHHFSNLEHTDGGFFIDNPLGIDEERTRQVRIDPGSGGRKDTLSRDKQSSGWKNRKGLAVDADKMKTVLQAVKSLRLGTTSARLSKGKELFSLSFRQDNLERAVIVREPQAGEDGVPCYPVVVDKTANQYCLEDAPARQLQAALDALARK